LYLLVRAATRPCWCVFWWGLLVSFGSIDPRINIQTRDPGIDLWDLEPQDVPFYDTNNCFIIQSIQHQLTQKWMEIARWIVAHRLASLFLIDFDVQGLISIIKKSPWHCLSEVSKISFSASFHRHDQMQWLPCVKIGLPQWRGRCGEAFRISIGNEGVVAQQMGAKQVTKRI
jgi:hypothetical protein